MRCLRRSCRFPPIARQTRKPENYMQNIETEKQKLVKKPTIARRYDVSERTIQCWMDEQRIPFVKIGYMVRFDPEACDRALARFNVSSAVEMYVG